MLITSSASYRSAMLHNGVDKAGTEGQLIGNIAFPKRNAGFDFVDDTFSDFRNALDASKFQDLKIKDKEGARQNLEKVLNADFDGKVPSYVGDVLVKEDAIILSSEESIKTAYAVLNKPQQALLHQYVEAIRDENYADYILTSIKLSKNPENEGLREDEKEALSKYISAEKTCRICGVVTREDELVFASQETLREKEAEEDILMPGEEEEEIPAFEEVALEDAALAEAVLEAEKVDALQREADAQAEIAAINAEIEAEEAKRAQIEKQREERHRRQRESARKHDEELGATPLSVATSDVESSGMEPVPGDNYSDNNGSYDHLGDNHSDPVDYYTSNEGVLASEVVSDVPLETDTRFSSYSDNNEYNPTDIAGGEYYASDKSYDNSYDNSYDKSYEKSNDNSSDNFYDNSYGISSDISSNNSSYENGSDWTNDERLIQEEENREYWSSVQKQEALQESLKQAEARYEAASDSVSALETRINEADEARKKYSIEETLENSVGKDSVGEHHDINDTATPDTNIPKAKTFSDEEIKDLEGAIGDTADIRHVDVHEDSSFAIERNDANDFRGAIASGVLSTVINETKNKIEEGAGKDATGAIRFVKNNPIGRIGAEALRLTAGNAAHAFGHALRTYASEQCSVASINAGIVAYNMTIGKNNPISKLSLGDSSQGMMKSLDHSLTNFADIRAQVNELGSKYGISNFAKMGREEAQKEITKLVSGSVNTKTLSIAEAENLLGAHKIAEKVSHLANNTRSGFNPSLTNEKFNASLNRISESVVRTTAGKIDKLIGDDTHVVSRGVNLVINIRKLPGRVNRVRAISSKLARNLKTKAAIKATRITRVSKRAARISKRVFFGTKNVVINSRGVQFLVNSRGGKSVVKFVRDVRTIYKTRIKIIRHTRVSVEKFVRGRIGVAQTKLAEKISPKVSQARRILSNARKRLESLKNLANTVKGKVVGVVTNSKVGRAASNVAGKVLKKRLAKPVKQNVIKVIFKNTVGRVVQFFSNLESALLKLIMKFLPQIGAALGWYFAIVSIISFCAIILVAAFGGIIKFTEAVKHGWEVVAEHQHLETNNPYLSTRLGVLTVEMEDYDVVMSEASPILLTAAINGLLVADAAEETIDGWTVSIGNFFGGNRTQGVDGVFAGILNSMLITNIGGDDLYLSEGRWQVVDLNAIAADGTVIAKAKNPDVVSGKYESGPSTSLRCQAFQIQSLPYYSPFDYETGITGADVGNGYAWYKEDYNNLRGSTYNLRVRFFNAEGREVGNRSNVKDILSMAEVVFFEDRGDGTLSQGEYYSVLLGEPDNMTIWQKALEESFLGRLFSWLATVGDNIIESVVAEITLLFDNSNSWDDLIAAADIKDDPMYKLERLYCMSLYHQSREYGMGYEIDNTGSKVNTVVKSCKQIAEESDSGYHSEYIYTCSNEWRVKFVPQQYDRPDSDGDGHWDYEGDPWQDHRDYYDYFVVFPAGTDSGNDDNGILILGKDIESFYENCCGGWPDSWDELANESGYGNKYKTAVLYGLVSASKEEVFCAYVTNINVKQNPDSINTTNGLFQLDIRKAFGCDIGDDAIETSLYFCDEHPIYMAVEVMYDIHASEDNLMNSIFAAAESSTVCHRIERYLAWRTNVFTDNQTIEANDGSGAEIEGGKQLTKSDFYSNWVRVAPLYDKLVYDAYPFMQYGADNSVIEEENLWESYYNANDGQYYGVIDDEKRQDALWYLRDGGMYGDRDSANGVLSINAFGTGRGDEPNPFAHWMVPVDPELTKRLEYVAKFQIEEEADGNYVPSQFIEGSENNKVIDENSDVGYTFFGSWSDTTQNNRDNARLIYKQDWQDYYGLFIGSSRNNSPYNKYILTSAQKDQIINCINPVITDDDGNEFRPLSNERETLIYYAMRAIGNVQYPMDAEVEQYENDTDDPAHGALESQGYVYMGHSNTNPGGELIITSKKDRDGEPDIPPILSSKGFIQWLFANFNMEYKPSEGEIIGYSSLRPGDIGKNNDRYCVFIGYDAEDSGSGYIIECCPDPFGEQYFTEPLTDLGFPTVNNEYGGGVILSRIRLSSYTWRSPSCYRMPAYVQDTRPDIEATIQEYMTNPNYGHEWIVYTNIYRGEYNTLRKNSATGTFINPFGTEPVSGDHCYGVQQNNGFSYYNVTTGNHWDPQKGTAGDVYEGEGNHLSQ